MVFESQFIKQYYYDKEAYKKGSKKKKILTKLGVFSFRVIKTKETNNQYYIEESLRLWHPLVILFIIGCLPLMIIKAIVYDGIIPWINGIIEVRTKPINEGTIPKTNVYKHFFPEQNIK